MHFFKQFRGFSLVELLLVLALIGIFSGLAWPAYRYFLGAAQAQVVLGELEEVLGLARRAAVGQGRVSVCLSLDQKTCAREGAGVLVLQSDKVLAHFEWERSLGNLSWHFFPAGRQEVEFLASGLTDSNNGHFEYRSTLTRGVYWTLVISKSGRVRVYIPPS